MPGNENIGVAIADAFRVISVGGTSISAEQVGDTFTIIAGSNIEITPNAATDSIEISASGSLAADLPITQDSSGNSTNYLVFSGSITGNLSPRVDTGLYYNPATGALASESFIGSLSGNAATVTNGFYTTSSFNLGTTSIAVNRASASQSLTGISIDGNAGTVTNGVYTNGSYSDPSWLTISASKVGLGNVTNESKATMFSSPTFTGTVSGITSTMVGLGNVENTALSTSTFYIGTTQITYNRTSASQTLNGISIDGNSGTVTNGVYTNGTYSDPSWLTISKSFVGLGSVENTALSTWTGSSSITTVGTLTDLTVSNTISGSINGNAATVTNGFYTSSSFNLGTTSIAVNRASASQSLTGVNIDGYAAGLAGGNNTTLLGSVPYQSNVNVTSLLGPNTTTTKKFLRQTGDGTNGAAPAWDTVTATDVALGNVTNESKATMFSGPTFTGTTTFQQFTEVLNTKTGATGVVDHDYSTGDIWWHTTPAANFTVNVTNVPTTDNRTIKIVVAIAQSAGAAYYPNALQIDGVAQTINWQFNQLPNPLVSKKEIATFLLVRVGAAWTVLGHWNSY